MTSESPAAFEPTPPLVIVDDDDWIDVYDSVQSMIDHLEYQSVDDEVAYVLDSRGRALELAVDSERIYVRRTGVPIDLTRFQESVESFLDRWTEDSAPARSSDAETYVDAVLDTYRHARFRSRRRKR
jgi:hypothetical protein